MSASYAPSIVDAKESSVLGMSPNFPVPPQLPANGRENVSYLRGASEDECDDASSMGLAQSKTSVNVSYDDGLGQGG